MMKKQEGRIGVGVRGLQVDGQHCNSEDSGSILDEGGRYQGASIGLQARQDHQN